MTLTTRVRINWPVPAVALLDAVTLAANGDPATVERDEEHPSPIWNMSWVRNRPGQGLDAYIHVRWSEQPDVGDEEPTEPPALVVLTIDTPEPRRGRPFTGEQLLALQLLPAVRDWLDDNHVPRTAWWWEDERNGEK
jgi:hypothetical protein